MRLTYDSEWLEEHGVRLVAEHGMGCRFHVSERKEAERLAAQVDGTVVEDPRDTRTPNPSLAIEVDAPYIHPVDIEQEVSEALMLAEADPEAADSKLDTVFKKVLTAVAHGQDNSQDLARIALTGMDIHIG